MNTLKLMSTLGATALLTAAMAVAGDLPPTGGPFVADYDAVVSPEVNSWGGVPGAFYGGGTGGFFQDDAQLTSNFDFSTGAWIISNEALPNADAFIFFGAFERIDDDGVTGIDILQSSAASSLTLSFDASLTTPTAWPQWGVRFEDVTPTGGGEFNNTTLTLTSINGTPEVTPKTYVVTLDQFLGVGQDVDFTEVMNLVFPALNTPAGGSGGTPYEVGLILDNVTISGGNLPADVVLFEAE